MPGSMGPWAGLKRCCIREACRSSLMSNLPHQKTFIPINIAFGEGTVCCLSTTPTSVSLSVLSAGDMLVFVHCACQIQGFLSKLYTNKAGCYVLFIYFFQTWCLCICMSQLSLLVQVCTSLTVGVFSPLKDQKCTIVCACLSSVDWRMKNTNNIKQQRCVSCGARRLLHVKLYSNSVYCIVFTFYLAFQCFTKTWLFLDIAGLWYMWCVNVYYDLRL